MASTLPSSILPQSTRRDLCNVCGQVVADSDPQCIAIFPCHVRAFTGQEFEVWRCPKCRCIHCLDVVDLDHYYSKYPFAKAKLDLLFRIFYINLTRRFLRHGMKPQHTFLDYGCANGLFVQYLRGRGFSHSRGYDPYQPASSEFGNPAVLDAEHDYVLLQDVIEHVEDPSALLTLLDKSLKPGGYILVGTPNADRLDLGRPDLFRNEVHAPYHLHIYTRDALEELGRECGWQTVQFYDRSYHDRPWFGLNTRTAKHYQMLMDGSFDTFFEPFDAGRAFTSPRFYFYALFGYWLSFRSDMSIMFHKRRNP